MTALIPVPASLLHVPAIPLPVLESPAAPVAFNARASGATGAGQADGEGDSSYEPPKKRLHRPSQVVLSFSDFSKHQIEEHYRISHAQRWADLKYTALKKGVQRDTNAVFFSRARITAHFVRREQGIKVVKVGHEIGLPSKELYAGETNVDARTESGLLLSYGEQSKLVEDIAILCTAERGSLHFIAALPSMPTFLRDM